MFGRGLFETSHHVSLSLRENFDLNLRWRLDKPACGGNDNCQWLICLRPSFNTLLYLLWILCKRYYNSSTEVPAKIWKCQCLTCGCHWALSTLSSWTHCCRQPLWWLLLLYIDRFGQSLPTIWSLQHISPFICHQIRPPKNSTHHRARRCPAQHVFLLFNVGLPRAGKPNIE